MSETVFPSLNLQIHFSGDKTVDYYGVFGWRVRSRSGERVYIFGHLTKFYMHTLLFLVSRTFIFVQLFYTEAPSRTS